MKTITKRMICALLTLMFVSCLFAPTSVLAEGDPHTHDLSLVAAVEPTETEEGNRAYYVCSECGEMFWDEDATQPVASADCTVIAATGHDYVAVETEATCTEGGYITHTCSICNDSYVDSEVAPLGHDWDDGVVTRDATQRDDGVKVYTCRRCGETKTEAVSKLPIDITKVFKDVKADDWFASAVEYAYVNRIMNGTSADKFSPNGTTNRAMVITVLWRLEGCPKASSEYPFEESGPVFEDLKDDWYLEAVAWGYENKLILGYTSLRFAPEEPVTREQLAAILYRYTQFKGGDVSASAKLDAFPDADKVSEYAKDPMAWAVSLGLISGSKNQGVTVLDPTGSATRAQFAAVMMRYAAK